MNFQRIIDNVYFCGLNDEKRKYFDELIPLECGTSYNSFLIQGTEKTALIDTMYLPKTEEYIKNLEENGVKTVDYIIANHGEQDHTGAIPQLLKKYPNAKVVTNNVCKNNIKEMIGIEEEKFFIIKNQDELSLGDKTLKFFLTPGVHWPDTMFTYLVEDNLLFTCDFLGAHYTFDNVWAEESETLELMAKRYYAEIMMPFRRFCKKYLELINEIKPEIILPSHGPIYKNTEFILDLYKTWTSDECKNLVLIPYISMYGSTLEMVNYVATKLKDKNITVKTFNIIETDLGDLAMHLVDAKTVILAGSMVLSAPHPAIMNIASLTGLLAPKTKYTAVIGSYGWGGKFTEKLLTPFENLPIEILGSILVKGKAKAEDYNKLDELVTVIIEKHAK